MPTEEAVRTCLSEIIDPCSVGTGLPLNILDMGLLQDIDIQGGHVAVRLRLTTPMCMLFPHFLDEVHNRVGALPDVDSVTCETDAGMDWGPEMMSVVAKRRLQELRESWDRKIGYVPKGNPKGLGR
jgi:metal-sulfur cluster biosynthetic enzyme